MNWINVKDKLPEDDQTVLMLEKGQESPPVIGWYEDKGCIPGFYPINIFQNVRMHVTHWIPIPRLPED